MANDLKLDVRTAEILGAFIGDGWIQSNKRAFYILGDRTEDRAYYDNYLGPMFKEVFGEINVKEFQSWKVYGLASYKKVIIEKCLELGFQSGKKALTVKIPDYIMDSSPEVKIALMRGIFDTDGSFWCERSRAKTSQEWKRNYPYHPMFQITSCSEKLLYQLATMLDDLGIHASIRCIRLKGVKCRRNVNNAYSLRINKIGHIRKWFEIIGTSNPRHKTKY